MSIDQCFDRSLINVESIAQELYDPQKPGVIAVPHFLTESFCVEARAEFRRNKTLFWDAPLVEGTSRQELKVHYSGPADGTTEGNDQFRAIGRLRESYAQFYKQLSNRCGFWQGSIINSQGLHWYQEGSCGMGVHRDYTKDINLLTLFVLSGNASFSVYRDKQKSKSLYEVETKEGMLVLMRGPRNPNENDLRPYHEIGEVKAERMCVIFRQKKTI